MLYYIFIGNGLDLMVTGPFKDEETAIEKQKLLIPGLTSFITLDKGKGPERLWQFTFWSKFQKTEFVRCTEPTV